MTKEYKYFISYGYWSPSHSGTGMCEYTSDKKLETYTQIVGMAEDIKRQSNYDTVVIINYKELKSD